MKTLYKEILQVTEWQCQMFFKTPRPGKYFRIAKRQKSARCTFLLLQLRWKISWKTGVILPGQWKLLKFSHYILRDAKSDRGAIRWHSNSAQYQTNQMTTSTIQIYGDQVHSDTSMVPGTTRFNFISRSFFFWFEGFRCIN